MATPATITTTKTVNISSYYIGSTYDSANIDSSYPISNGYAGSDSTTYAKIPLTQGRDAETSFIYSFASLSSIPSNATINSVTCSAKLGISTTGSKYITARTVQLCTGPSGSTLMGSASTVGSGSSVYTLTTGTWTRSQLTSAKLRLYATRGTSGTSSVYYFAFYGATLTVNYTFEGYNYDVIINTGPVDICNGIVAAPVSQSVQEGSAATDIVVRNPWAYSLDIVDNGVVVANTSATSYTYSLTDVQADHAINFRYHSELQIKSNNAWQPIIKSYIKTNGVWTVQPLPNTPFSLNRYYKNGKTGLFDNCPSFVKLLSNLDIVADSSVGQTSGISGVPFIIIQNLSNFSLSSSLNQSYAGDLTEGETYYAFGTCSRNQSNQRQMFAFFEINYTDIDHITWTKLFSNSENLDLLLATTVGGYTAKCIKLVDTSMSQPSYSIAVGTLTFFKKSSVCPYSYQELSAMASNVNYWGVCSNFYGDGTSSGYMDITIGREASYTPSQWYGTNKSGYLITAISPYINTEYETGSKFSISYLDVTSDPTYAFLYPFYGDCPGNISLYRPNSNITLNTTNYLYISYDGSNLASEMVGLFAMQILPDIL